MKKVILVLIGLLSLQSISVAQNRKSKTKAKPELTPVVVKMDSAKWREEHYIVNRDSAYANPRIALKKLMGGNKRFVEGKSIRPRQDAETIKKLENGQQPFATIVGCSDSRVPNELIFDQGIGDLFIIRTAGQVSAAASYGSMEFATLKLKTKLILVLGHTECGAVAAAV